MPTLFDENHKWWEKDLDKEEVRSEKPIWQVILDSDPDSRKKLMKSRRDDRPPKKVRKIWCRKCGKLGYRVQIQSHGAYKMKVCLKCLKICDFDSWEQRAVIESEVIEEFIKEEKQKGRAVPDY